MKKKIIALLLCAVVTLSLTGCSGEPERSNMSSKPDISDNSSDTPDSGSVGTSDSVSDSNFPETSADQFGYGEENGTITIQYYEGEDTEINIPQKINGKPVTRIGNLAFMWCRSLTSVVIPDGVTVIESSAFWECTSLTNVTIPDSVTSIGDSAFYGCTSLTSMTIPTGVKEIGGNAFGDTPWLENKQKENPLVIVNGILIDGEKCEESVTVPNSVTSIGDFAFGNCECTITYKGKEYNPDNYSELYKAINGK